MTVLNSIPQITRKIKAVSLLLVMILVMALPIQTLAKSDDDYDQEYKNSSTKYQAIIIDEANLLSSSEEKTVLNQMKNITEYTNVAFVTTDNNRSTTRDYAERCLHELFGRGKDGTLFIIDMDNREIYIYSDGSTLYSITESYSYTITDNVFDYAADGEYMLCAYNAFDQMYKILDGQKIAQPMKYICNAFLSVVLAMFIVFLIVKSSSETHKVSSRELLKYTNKQLNQGVPTTILTHTSKVYRPPSSSSGGGGGHSGGGGGGHSGGGGGHKF